MAITKKRIKPNYHDKKLIVEDVSQAQLPDDTYNITIRDAFIDTLADIRTLKPATWARINHSPSKTMFHLSNEPNVNTHDISSIRTLCLTKPEYSHFLLPRALRTKFTEDTGRNTPQCVQRRQKSPLCPPFQYVHGGLQSITSD